MIDIEKAITREVSFQHVSQEEKESGISTSLSDSASADEVITLRKLLLKPFVSHAETFEFDHHVELNYNVLFNIAKDIFDDKNFLEQSKKIHQHLVSVSTHPNISDGDLFIARFDGIRVGGNYLQGLGVYKFEQKEGFIETSTNDGSIEANFRQGLGSKKPEKGCLILFDDEPYTILVIDSNSKETDYWQQDFIQHRPKQDHVNSTNNFLKMTKSYITDQMPNEFDVEKTDQIELLNKSLDFFKSNDTFNESEFENTVLGDVEAIKSFKTFGDSYKQTNEVTIAPEFDIAPQSVKKQARIFKSVLKLDKNFHVYIHGDRSKIEKGADEKGDFYKIYYQNER